MVWRGVEIKNATIRPCLVRPLTDSESLWCLFGVFVSWWRKLFFHPSFGRSAGRKKNATKARRHQIPPIRPSLVLPSADGRTPKN